MGGDKGCGFLSAFDYVLQNLPSEEHEALLEDLLILAKDFVKEYTYDEQGMPPSFPDIHVISHLADADGLGSIPPLQFGLPPLFSFLGVYPEISSERIMSYKKSGDDSLLGIVDNLKRSGKDNVIVCSTDLADFPYEDARLALEYSGVVKKIFNLDHHPMKSIPRIHNLESIIPDKYDLNGEKELSGSILSSLLMLATAKEMKSTLSPNDVKDVSVRDGLNRLDEQLDYLLLVGLSGASADMQKQEGINGLIHDYLKEKDVLSSVKSPFFGYRTKTISASVFGESEIPINMKYRLPLKSELQSILKDVYGSPIDLFSSDEKDFFYDEIKFLFAVKEVDEELEFGVNSQYLHSLSLDELLVLNNKLKSVLSYTPLVVSSDTSTSIDFLRPDTSAIPILFDDFTDDIKNHDLRLKKGNALLGNYGITADTKLSDLSEENKDLLFDYCKDNVRAFADPNIRDVMLAHFDDDLYLVNSDAFDSIDALVLGDLSIPEIGNIMTAVSKLGKGDVFYRAVQNDILGEFMSSSGLGGESAIQELNRIVLEYKDVIRLGSSTVESYIQNENRLETLGDNVYFVSLDDLDIGEAQRDDMLRKLTGVFGGIACNTRQLPGNYGVLATSFLYDKTPGREKVKVSLRANRLPDKEMIHFGQYLSDLVNKELIDSGGGHPDAASCSMDIANLDAFKDALGRQEVFYDKKYDNT